MSNRERLAVRQELDGIVRGKSPRQPRRHRRTPDCGYRDLGDGKARVAKFIESATPGDDYIYKVDVPVDVELYDELVAVGMSEKDALDRSIVGRRNARPDNIELLRIRLDAFASARRKAIDARR